jgi:hypothetical protein
MAIATVKQFLDTVKKNKISKSTQFRLLQFDGCPSYVKREFQEDGGYLYLKTGSVPARTITEISVQYQGFKFPIPGQVEYESPQEFTFRTPENFLWRNALEQWSFDTFNEMTGNGIGFPCDNSIMDIGLVNDAGQLIRIYRYFNIWPTKVGSISYNLSEAPTEVEFPVSFAFTRWAVITVTDDGSLDDSNSTDEQKAIFEQYRSAIETAKASCVK